MGERGARNELLHAGHRRLTAAHRAAEPAAVGRPGVRAFSARPGVAAYLHSSTRRAVAPGG